MNTSKIVSTPGNAIPTRHDPRPWAIAVLAVFVAISSDLTLCRAQQSDYDAPGTEVLTRGPVHEAFAGMVTFNPQPGVVVTKAPPDIIEEMPPAERPEGDNVAWIPGYWGWDDERADFLWVSGTWRALPPGRAWMAGYWGKTPQGFQWTSGYWADARARETTYLPPPPASIEAGPNVAAPSLDYGWAPGCWIWYSGRYAWQPGYWALGRVDWDWMPAHYLWTPRGFIFVGGFWDYPVAQRGILFAPVYFNASVYSRPGYYYSPSIVINLGVFSDHLFLRPRYSHYYFGDYYAPSYYQAGFYASYSFQSSRYGYDPIYSHQRWEHREDREWSHRVEASYENRRDHEAARPPRTWAAQRNINPATSESRQNRLLVATPIDQLARSKDNSMRFQPVAKAEREKLAQRGQEVQQSRDQRRTLEATGGDTIARKPVQVSQPTKVQQPKSTIVAKSADKLGRNQLPPKTQQAPKPDLKVQANSQAPGRPPNVDRGNPKSQPREIQTERKPAPGQREPLTHDQKVQPEATPRSNDAPPDTQAQPQRNGRGLEQQAKPESAPREKDPAVTPPEQSQQNQRGSEKLVPQESGKSGKQRPDHSQRGATRLLKDDRQNQSKENSPRSK